VTDGVGELAYSLVRYAGAVTHPTIYSQLRWRSRSERATPNSQLPMHQLIRTLTSA
jgi:hypothetical protein